MNKKVHLIICNKKNAIKSAAKNIHTVRSAAQIPYKYTYRCIAKNMHKTIAGKTVSNFV